MNQTKLFSFTRFLALTLPLLAVVLVFSFVGPRVASAADPALVCTTGVVAPLILDATQNITNDVDSGNHGNWALDTYARHIQVWQEGATYCAKVDYDGTFLAPVGVLSPQNGSPLTQEIRGTMKGGYTKAITASATTTSPVIPTALDYNGTLANISTWTDALLPKAYKGGTSQAWLDEVFAPGYTATFINGGNGWSWTYATPENGTWVNAGTGSTGDIGAVVLTRTGVGYASIQDAMGAASDGDTVALGADITTSAQITITKAITLDGNGHSLKSTFQKTDNFNNSAIGIQHSGVTIKNLIVDGATGGQSSPNQLHGINVYLATSTILNSVTVSNFGGSGIVVGGSEVTATNLNTSGNKWNSVNVDPGSGVTVPSVFTLTSGNLADKNQIWSDGKNVTPTATVTVNAAGYTMYKPAGTTTAFLWSNKPIANAASITRDNVQILYSNLSAALAAASSTSPEIVTMLGDSTTTAQITIDKQVTLDGGGFTIRPTFSKASKTDYGNNSAIGIQHSGVTLKNIILDGAMGGQSWPTQLHGINIYLSTDVNLTSVTVSKFGGSGVVVNGSTVTAANLNTNGNKWNSVNVDPGVDVKAPSVFTLMSGALADTYQIWSDGNNVTSSTTVTVEAEGYKKYVISGTPGTLWANALRNVASLTKDGVTSLYSTIIAAVKTAQDGDTVKVYPGDYNLVKDDITPVAGQTGWYLPITKNNITLLGVDLSGEEITDASAVTTNIYSTQETTNGIWSSQDLIAVFGDNVTIRGLGIMNKIEPNKAIEVMGNNFKAEFNKFMPIPKSLYANADNYLGDDITKYGSGVYFNNNGATTTRTATVNNNIFNNSGVTFDSFGNNWTMTVRNNTFDGNKIWTSGGSPSYYSSVGATTWANQPNFTGSTITISKNKLINMVSGKLNLKLKDGMIGEFNAAKNWWGTASSTEIAARVSAHVNYIPWCTNSDCTSFSNTHKNNENEGDNNNGQHEDEVHVSMPDETTITGDDDWDGQIEIPTVTKKSVTVSGFDTEVSSAVAVGSSKSDLTFDKGVRLLFAKQKDKLAGWYNHAGAFSEITTVCAKDDQATGNALPAGGNCKINSGNDLVIWTKHFTTFVTYTQTAKPVPAPVYYGGGGGGYSVSVAAPAPRLQTVYPDGKIVYHDAPVTKNNATNNNEKQAGKVLGVSTFNFTRDLGLGSRGDDVTELQKRLISESLLSGEPTGYFGKVTRDGVKKFQVKNSLPATGLVGAKTRAVLNGAIAGGFVLPPTANATNTPAAVNSPRFNFTLTHGTGSRGNDVTELQKRLIAEGLLSTDATGYFGKLTSDAVKKFQEKNGIPATGLVGPMTRAALNK